MSAEQRYFIGMDGGGSGCRVRLADARGRPLAEAVGGPANVNTDPDATLHNLLDATRRAYAQAGLDAARRRHDLAWAGLAGASVGDHAAHMKQALGFAATGVSTDREITVEGALGREDGCVALVGTGSFLVCRMGGKMREIGGWGYQLGDECGGAWLGREALRATLRAVDGLIAHSPMTRAILEDFGGAPMEIVRFAHDSSPGEIAALAPRIAGARERGDPVATRIFEEALALLLERLEALDARQAGALCLLGGLAPIYRDLLPAPWVAMLRAPKGDALDGAIALAMQQLRCPEPEGG